MNYAEAKKQATQGLLVANHLAPHLSPIINGGNGGIVAEFEHTTEQEQGKDPVNAALLAHCFNHFDELLEAAKTMTARMTDLLDKGAVDPFYEAAMQSDIEALLDDIAKCEEVEGI